MNVKDPKILAVMGVLALVLIFGGLFLLTNKKTQPVETEEATQSDVVPTIAAADIGLKLVLTPDNKHVKVEIDKASDIKRVEGDITYDADSDIDKTVKVTQDISIDEKVTSSPFATDDFDLATCSKNICRYHTGFDKVDALLKITKKDGKVYSAQVSTPINK